MTKGSAVTGAEGRARAAIVALGQGDWPWRWLLLGLGVALALLHALRCLPILAAHGIEAPVRLPGELSTLASYGKWWVLPPHRYLTDGFSGEMPTYYNYVSDTLVNLLAALGGWPSLTVQVALYGPLLAAVFFWGNVASLRLVTRERGASLIGALLLSLSSGSGLLGLLLSPERAAELTTILHVPARALAFGTSQALGWVLFLPALASFHAANEGFTRRRAVACGVLTGLLPHVHTLTLVNVAFGQLGLATAANAVALPAGRLRRLWLSSLAVLVAAFAAHVLTAPLSLAALAAFGALGMIVNFAVSSRRSCYLWVYGIAGLVMLPYALAVTRGMGPAAAPAHVGGYSVAPGLLLAFYAAHVLAALLVLGSRAPRSAFVFFGSLLAVNLGLSYNDAWGWSNHPYRFAINLLFPLCGLAALGITRGPRRPALVAGAWLGAIVAANVGQLVLSARHPGDVSGFDEGTAVFLARVREVTAESPADARVLNPPEHHYPEGMQANTLLFSYARRPGFLPDYRYLLDNGPYLNRLALFCFLFPGYPAVDVHLGQRRACEEDLQPPAELVTLREVRLRTAILPVYGLRHAAAVGRLFSGALARSEAEYGWGLVAEVGNKRRLVRLDPPSLPGLARMQRVREGPLGQILPFDVDQDGDYVFVLGGRRLHERVERLRLDGQGLSDGEWRGNWAVLRAPLRAGRHELVLERAGRDAGGERDVLYFVAIVEGRLAAHYLELAFRRLRPAP